MAIVVERHRRDGLPERNEKPDRIAHLQVVF
jgi:hypothetical protein